MVAHRTSPTNIGLALLANLAAYDFGYLPTGRLLERTARTLRSMARLERYRGHFYNWYDTRTLQAAAAALRLDRRQRQSGRSPAHAAQSDCWRCRTQPIVPQRVFAGLADTLGRPARNRRQARPRDNSRNCGANSPLAIAAGSDDAWRRAGDASTGWLCSLGELRGERRRAAGRRRRSTPMPQAGLAWRVAARRSARPPATSLHPVARWTVAGQPAGRCSRRLLAACHGCRRLRELAGLEARRAADSRAGTRRGPRCGNARRGCAASGPNCREQRDRAAGHRDHRGPGRAGAMHCATPDFDFLYDTSRRLLSIGYNVTERRLRHELLRPAGVGGAAGSFVGHRPGTAAAGALVRPGTTADGRRRRRRRCSPGAARCSST